MARIAPAPPSPPGAASAGALSVRGLTKAYALGGERLPVLEDLSFDVAPGEFVSFVGPSGSGKSTLLGIVAGLEEPDAGIALVGGSPERLGRAAYMPQADVLLPWRSAIENAVLGLEVRGVPKGEARRRARDLFGVAGLAGFEDAYPDALSGGMRQRVAFLRTLLAGGPLMLLDEPFGALDALTRSEMHAWLLGLWERRERRASHSVVLVTHDVEEALLLSDRVYVLSHRPARVRRALDVPFPRPRSLELVATGEFARRRAELLGVLRAGGAS